MHDSDNDIIPEAWRGAAEEIRQHLVTLRGGALFLSPSDALQVVLWLEQGVAVADILRAMERAHEARRQRRSRIPFGLGQVKRHLKGLAKGAPAPAASVADEVGEVDLQGGPFEGLAGEVRRRSAGDRHGEAMRALAGALESVPRADRDTAARAALAAVRRFREAVWEATPQQERQRARDRAREEIGELGAAVDEATLAALVDEEARESVRAGYAWLCAATIWDVVEEQCLP